MRAPKWFREGVATRATRILERAIDERDARVELCALITSTDENFARDIVEDYVARQLKASQKSHHVFIAEATDGQLDLFPRLPRRMEISPGRFADQAVMTGSDWDAALKQAKTKADNVNGFYDSVQQAYDRVRPLLTRGDLTTADVWKSGDQRAIGGTP